MRGQRTLNSKIVFSFDDSTTKQSHPDSIYAHASGQRVIVLHQPPCECQAISRRVIAEGGEDLRDIGLDRVTRSQKIAADLHMSLPRPVQHVLEILGILLLFMPFLWIVFHHSLDWVADSYRVAEASSSPQGLPHRWIIKSIIPISFVLMFLAALARLIQETLLLFHYGKEPVEDYPGKVNMLRKLFKVQARIKDIEKGEG